MATATINGKPSVFFTPTEIPTEQISPSVDYQTRIATHLQIASEMATELETPEAEMTDEDLLNDPEFRADYNEYLEGLEREWLNDPKAQAEFDAYLTEQERLADEEAMLDALCEAYDADADELARLGDAARSYIAGHDAVWQQGGEV